MAAGTKQATQPSTTVSNLASTKAAAASASADLGKIASHHAHRHSNQKDHFSVAQQAKARRESAPNGKNQAFASLHAERSKGLHHLNKSATPNGRHSDHHASLGQAQKTHDHLNKRSQAEKQATARQQGGSFASSTGLHMQHAGRSSGSGGANEPKASQKNSVSGGGVKPAANLIAQATQKMSLQPKESYPVSPSGKSTKNMKTPEFGRSNSSLGAKKVSRKGSSRGSANQHVSFRGGDADGRRGD